MAEIKVEHRKGMSMWAWLIPLLIVIALLWWFLARDQDDDFTAHASFDAPALVAMGDAHGTTNLTTLAAIPVVASLPG